MHRIIRPAVLALMAGLGLVGCDTILGPDDDPARIAITGSRSTLDVLGDTVHLSAVVRTEDGRILPNASVAWDSRTPAVATVGSEGVVTAASNGGTWIIARSGSARDSMRIDVSTSVSCAPEGELDLPDTVGGGLSTSDCRIEGAYVDAWSLSLAGETVVTIRLLSSDFDALLFLLDNRGNYIAVDDDGEGGTDSRITATLPAGQYILYATSYFTGVTGAYQLMAQVGVPPSPCPATDVVALPDTVTGTTAPGGCVLQGFHLDVWRLEVPTDTSVVLQVDSDDYQAAVVVADTLGQFLEGSGSGPGTSAWLEVYLPAGSYDIWLGARDVQEANGSYTLSVRHGPALSLCQSAGTLELSAQVSGELSVADCFAYTGHVDGWDLEITDSTVVALTLASSEFWPLILVTDSTGGFHTVIYSEGEVAEDEVTLAPGRYRIWAIAEDGRAGGYTLSARPAGQMIPCEPDGAIVIGDTVAAALSTTDCQFPDGRYADVWTTRLDSAATVQVTVSSDKFDAYLILADSSGARLAWDDDGAGNGNATLTLELGAGLYQLWATSYEAEVVGGYTLSLVEVDSASAQRSDAVTPKGGGGRSGRGAPIGSRTRRTSSGRSVARSCGDSRR